MTNTCFRLVSNDITYDSFDGELVIVDLGSGAYYSANATGALIWAGLLDGMTMEQATREVCGDTAESEAAEAVSRFVNELLLNKLLVADPATAASSHTTSSELQSHGERAVFVAPLFVAPVLTRYDDLEALLLLDPIHDVDEAGWPSPRVGQPR